MFPWGRSISLLFHISYVSTLVFSYLIKYTLFPTFWVGSVESGKKNISFYKVYSWYSVASFSQNRVYIARCRCLDPLTMSQDEIYLGLDCNYVMKDRATSFMSNCAWHAGQWTVVSEVASFLGFCCASGWDLGRQCWDTGHENNLKAHLGSRRTPAENFPLSIISWLPGFLLCQWVYYWFFYVYFTSCILWVLTFFGGVRVSSGRPRS